MDSLEAYDDVNLDNLEEAEDVDEDGPDLWSHLTLLEMSVITITDTPIDGMLLGIAKVEIREVCHGYMDYLPSYATHNDISASDVTNYFLK